MTNLFVYTRVESVNNDEQKLYIDSFNLNKVVRSLTLEDGRVLVLLDDLHERAHEVPDIDMKNNRVKGVKRVRDVFQSEIYLSPEEGERFYRKLNDDARAN